MDRNVKLNRLKKNSLQEDEVGRGCPEASVLYCSSLVVRLMLAHIGGLVGDKAMEVSRGGGCTQEYYFHSLGIYIL